jgi:Zn-dependent protease with chaperone function
MDFFAAQERAHARTRLLVVYFILGVAGLVICLNVLAMIGVGVSRANHGGARQSYDSSNYDQSPDETQGAGLSWNPAVNVFVTLGTLAVVGGACMYKISELRAGGSAVALSLGARLVSPQTTDLAEKRLRNIVEEMALASGVPVPEIYVMEEDGINAFAAGFRPEDACVTVTRGALNNLNREELQGVIAHEFSHILNGDMKLNIELVGAVFGLLVLSIIGRQIVFSMRGGGRRGNQGQAGIMVAGVALIVLGSLGVLFGRLIQAAVARQRERLADASGVQFTRNPEGLANALKKIGGLAAGSQIEHAHVQETAHMFFAPALNSMFATHPPLEERIRELEPQWDGRFIIPRPTVEEDEAPLQNQTPPTLSSILPSSLRNAAGLLAPASVIAAVSLANVRAWRANLPVSLTAALGDAGGCRAVVLALALDDDAAQRAAQLEKLRQTGEPAAAACAALAADVAAVPPGQQLPLLELALGGLAGLSPVEKTSLLARLRDLTGFDRGPTLHQFALWRVAEYRLKPRPPRDGPAAPENYRNDISVVLSALADLSTKDAAAAQPVFALGLAALPPELAGVTLTPRAQATLDRVEMACLRLEGAPFALKKQLLQAGALIAQADGVVEPAEAELLRALAASLGCALPPG